MVNTRRTILGGNVAQGGEQVLGNNEVNVIQQVVAQEESVNVGPGGMGNVGAGGGVPPNPFMEGSVHTARSTASAVVIARLENQLRNRDYELGEMRQTLMNAGLLRNNQIENPVGPAAVMVERPRREEPIVQGSEVESSYHPHMPQHRLNMGVQAGGTFKSFMECRPPSFQGDTEPLVCVRWIRKMEQVFDSGVFTDEQKVNYAIRMLEGKALEWWDSVNQSLTRESRRNYTWEKFSEKLSARFSSGGALEKYEREFTSLVKGKKSVAEYIDEFTEKLQFARHLCPTEASLVKRFMNGLPYPYRGAVRVKTTLEEAMEEAVKIEDDLRFQEEVSQVELGEVKEEKRKFDGSAGSSKGKLKKFHGDEQRGKARACTTCHSSHWGPCNRDTVKCNKCGRMGHFAKDCQARAVVCYKCHEEGHISTNCPKARQDNAAAGARPPREIPRAMARAFNMNTQGEDPDKDVTVGELLNRQY